jgi:hypothetical protein
MLKFDKRVKKGKKRYFARALSRSVTRSRPKSKSPIPLKAITNLPKVSMLLKPRIREQPPTLSATERKHNEKDVCVDSPLKPWAATMDSVDFLTRSVTVETCYPRKCSKDARPRSTKRKKSYRRLIRKL